MSGDLPDGWRWVKLEDVCRWGSGGTPRKGIDGYYGGPVPWAVIADLNDGMITRTGNSITEKAIAESSAKWIPANSLLVAMYGSIGKLGVTGTRMTTNQAIAHAIPSDEIDLMFLFWTLRNDRERLKQSGKGIAQSNISQTVLKKWEIPLPPLHEQHRIVAQLETQLAAAERAQQAAQAQLVALDALPAALLREMFPRSPAARLPRGWRWVKLGDTCEVLDAIRKPVKKALRNPGPYPYYGASGIVDYVDDYLLDEPVVLVGEDGAKWDSGEQSAFTVSGRCWVNNHAHILRPDRAVVLDDVLVSALNVLDLNPYITGLTVPKLTQRALREVPLGLPPLSVQEEIARSVQRQRECSNHARVVAQAQLDAANTLPAALLRLAFPA